MTTIAQRVERIQKEISGVRALYGVNQSDEAFLDNIKWLGHLSPRQERYLADLEVRVFGEEE